MRDVRRVPIGARSYRIVWDGELVDHLAESVEPERVGVCYGIVAHVDRRIILHPDYNTTPDGTIETLIHECLHVAEPFLGQTIDHDTLDALANLITGILLKSGLVDPRELAIAGVPLMAKRAQKAGSVDVSPLGVTKRLHSGATADKTSRRSRSALVRAARTEEAE